MNQRARNRNTQHGEGSGASEAPDQRSASMRAADLANGEGEPGEDDPVGRDRDVTGEETAGDETGQGVAPSDRHLTGEVQAARDREVDPPA